MATTKSPPAKKSGSTRSRSSKGASSARRPQSSRRRTSGRSSAGNGSSPSPVEAVRQTVANGAQQTGHAIGDAASKAKAPALAGGAALAGMMGGMAIASRAGRRRVLGIPVPGTRRPLVQIKPRRKGVAKDVVKAAGKMGRAGGQMAELAGEVRMAREQLERPRRRSPIEVVLEGLTSRRGRAG
jgi:hypothetical protein